MKHGIGSVLATIAVLTVTGLAHAADGGSVPVYDATQVALDRYVVVKRIGIGDRRSALGIPGQETLDAAKDAVLREAARIGADGVVNLTCFDQTDRLFKPGGYFCYANAVRVKK